MSTRPMTSPAVLFGRLFWMLAGPMFLLVFACYIALEGAGWFTILDLAYFAVLGGMLLGRWLEFRSGEAMTGTGEPATPAHLRRYLVTTSLAGLGLWLFVKAISSVGS